MSRVTIPAQLREPRWRIVRFLIVGLLNTGFSYLLYAIFLSLGLHYTIANLLALIIGILFSFKTQGALVFHNRAPRLLGRFTAAWLGIYGVNIATIAVFTHWGLDAYTAGALALPVTTSLSYLMQKHLVFRPQPRPTGTTSAGIS